MAERPDPTALQVPLNHFKRALAAGKQQIGLWNSLASASNVEVIAGAGFDWVLIDMEHSPNDLPLVHAQLQAIAAVPDSAPVIRPPWNDMTTIKRLLDLGAQSFLIPYVQSAADAATAVRHTRYPPHGVRGFASASRATRFGRIPAYWQHAHEEICVLVQVETRDALREIEAIAEVDGALARHYLDMGSQFVAVGADVVLLAKAADALRARFAAPR